MKNSSGFHHLRTFHFDSTRDIGIRGAGVFILDSRRGTALVKGANRGMADKLDWAAFTRWVRSGSPALHRDVQEAAEPHRRSQRGADRDQSGGVQDSSSTVALERQ